MLQNKNVLLRGYQGYTDKGTWKQCITSLLQMHGIDRNIYL